MSFGRSQKTKNGYFRAMENYGCFEGWVGQDPKPVENKNNSPQCFLHVGHRPSYLNKETGEWVKKLPVWIHFVLFDAMAEYAMDNIRTGQRVQVFYELGSRFHPQFKFTHSFVAVKIRPIADHFTTGKKHIGGSAEEMWLPKRAKGSKEWTPEELERALG